MIMSAPEDETLTSNRRLLQIHGHDRSRSLNGARTSDSETPQRVWRLPAVRLEESLDILDHAADPPLTEHLEKGCCRC